MSQLGMQLFPTFASGDIETPGASRGINSIEMPSDPCSRAGCERRSQELGAQSIADPDLAAVDNPPIRGRLGPRVIMAAASLPACGSVSASAIRHFPATMRVRNAAFCSSLP